MNDEQAAETMAGFLEPVNQIAQDLIDTGDVHICAAILGVLVGAVANSTSDAPMFADGVCDVAHRYIDEHANGAPISFLMPEVTE